MKLILIDGKNALYRFGWAMKTLHTTSGVPTGAIHGFIKCLLRLKQKYPQSRFVVCWDSPNSWRKDIFPEYKANRHKGGEISAEVKAIFDQEEIVVRLCDLLGVQQFKFDRLEADDCISLLIEATVEDCEHVVYSNDQDFWQLLCMVDNIEIARDGKDGITTVTTQDILNSYRCLPGELLSVRAIAGDSSDGIPGVLPKVGAVRAAALVADGAKPQWPTFESTPIGWRRRIAALKPVWDKVHRNYLLMRMSTIESIPQTVDRPRLKFQLRKLRDYLYTSRQDVDAKRYNQLIEFFGEYQLLQAMAERHKLLRLNS